MKVHNGNIKNKLFSVPMMGIMALLLAVKPDSTSSIVSGFYADGYAVDLFMLAIALAFIAIMIILKLREKNKDS